MELYKYNFINIEINKIGKEKYIVVDCLDFVEGRSKTIRRLTSSRFMVEELKETDNSIPLYKVLSNQE
jgi:hypothetical protein